jgi:recombination protein RecT
MDQQLAERKEDKTGLEKIKTFVLSPEAQERFTAMMGSNAIYYLNQVMILVANSAKLQECTPQSVLISAMRAASLRLSVDPIKGQAWIIPYAKRATFQLGYKGVYELAMRTHQYRFINVIDIFEGEVITENRMTGMHAIGGKRTSDNAIGFMLYFQMYDGFEKTFYMTVQQIEQHAANYSRSYTDGDSPWNAKGGRERVKMMRKTVLTNGLRQWGRFNEADDDMLNEIEKDQGFIDRLHEMPAENEVTIVDGMNIDLQAQPSGPAKPASMLMDELGFSEPDAIITKVEPPTEPAKTFEPPAMEAWQMTEDEKHTPYVELTNDDLAHRLTSIVNRKQPADKPRIEYIKNLLQARNTQKAA